MIADAEYRLDDIPETKISLLLNDPEMIEISGNNGGPDLASQERNTDVIVDFGIGSIKLSRKPKLAANPADHNLGEWLRLDKTTQLDEGIPKTDQMKDLSFAPGPHPQLVKHRMDQKNNLVESGNLLLVETSIENANVDIGVKDYFFLQASHLFKLEMPRIPESNLSQLNVGVELFKDDIDGLFLRLCPKSNSDTIDLLLIQFNGFPDQRHNTPPLLPY